MTLEERVVQILRRLPNVQQQEVLDFAELLQAQVLPTQPIAAELEPLPTFSGFVPQGWKEYLYDDKS